MDHLNYPQNYPQRLLAPLVTLKTIVDRFSRKINRLREREGCYGTLLTRLE